MRATVALALVLLVLAPAFAGCASTTSETVIAPRGPPSRGPGFSVPIVEPDRERLADVTEPVADPEAPPVFRNGTVTHATALLVHEAGRRHEAPGVLSFTKGRILCGGAVLAVPQGDPDPRDAAWPLAYEESRMITDGWGREWTTDLYVARDPASNATRPVWVQNLYGIPWFLPEDGKKGCRAFEYASTRFNVLLHAWDHEDALDLYFSPTTRPPVDRHARNWILP